MFITFEGIDGSGKSTVAKAVYDHLNKEGHDVILTREPGGTEFGNKIRDMILDPDNKISGGVELQLFMADRIHHVETKILPHLEKGGIVLCDRYHDSMVAYQGFGRGVPVTQQPPLIPDITIYLKGDPKVLLWRAKNRNTEDRIEEESLEFFNRVVEGYNKLSAANADRFVIINAEERLETVVRETTRIVSIVTNLVEGRKRV